MPENNEVFTEGLQQDGEDDVWVNSFFLVQYKSNEHACLGNALTLQSMLGFASPQTPAGCFPEREQVREAAVSPEHSPRWQR